MPIHFLSLSRRRTWLIKCKIKSIFHYFLFSCSSQNKATSNKHREIYHNNISEELKQKRNKKKTGKANSNNSWPTFVITPLTTWKKIIFLFSNEISLLGREILSIKTSLHGDGIIKGIGNVAGCLLANCHPVWTGTMNHLEGQWIRMERPTKMERTRRWWVIAATGPVGYQANNLTETSCCWSSADRQICWSFPVIFIFFLCLFALWLFRNIKFKFKN